MKKPDQTVGHTPPKPRLIPKLQPMDNTIQIRLINGEDPERKPSQVHVVPATTSKPELNALINAIQQNEEKFPYSCYANNLEITTVIPCISSETIVDITYFPESPFRCFPVARNTHTMQGHSNSILDLQFSPESDRLLTCGGDHTVRLWDLHSCTPVATLQTHPDWVCHCAWHPSGTLVASGDKRGTVRVTKLDGAAGTTAGSYAHRNFVTGLAFSPFVFGAALLASCSHDFTAQIYDVELGRVRQTLGGHTMGVTSLQWSGHENILYTSSRDRTVLVHDLRTGKPAYVLKRHAHWVNELSLSTGYVLQQGGFDILGKQTGMTGAKHRLDTALSAKERLVSASDDGTLYLWEPLATQQPLRRLVGHSSQVMGTRFSPDGRHIASCSCDKNIKIWDGFNGLCEDTLRGHVQTVYRCAWSPDSRMLVSASKDSTVKLWSMAKGSRKLLKNLPGHRDEVFCVDWSMDGSTVATGSYDHTIKIWRS